MVKIHPQYITDSAGEKMIVLPESEFNSLIEQLEDMHDVQLYDEAKKNDDGERISMEDAFNMIESKRKGK